MGNSSSIWNRLRGLFAARPSPGKAAPQAGEPQEKPSPARTEDRKSTVSPVPSSVVDLVLGLDLGTSCTKVVIGDPGWKDCSFAVPLGPSGNGISTWLHPTRFGSEANLKMRLMRDPDSEHVRDLLACYLAQIIALSRSWFVSNSPADYRRREIRWSLNVGFPGKRVDTGPLAAAYRQVSKVANALSLQPEPASPQLAASIRLNSAKTTPQARPNEVQLYPEIAAQLAGYVNSPFRRPGNLVLIDVGAGTLDTSTIILHGNKDQDIVSFHVCEVASLGVLRLYQERLEALERMQAACVRAQMEQFQGGDKAIPESFEEMVHPEWKRSAQLKRTFLELSACFEQEVINSTWSCLARFRKLQKEVHDSPAYEPWGDTLRFFITGGGSRSKFYRRLLADGPLEERIMPYVRHWHTDAGRRQALGQGLLLEPLPLPDAEKFRNFPPSLRSDFDRLSVAYGLAFGGENLMKVTAATHH